MLNINRKHNIASASRQALRLPRHSIAVLTDGTRIALRRLSWAEALLLWEEFSATLLDLCGGASEGGADGSVRHPDADAAVRATGYEALAALPALALRLAAICAGEDEAETAQREACDVLAIAAAALTHNFIAPRGVADFFGAVAELSG